MIYISVKNVIKTFASAKEKLGPRQFSLAISRSINEAMMQGRTQARAAVKDFYNIPQRYVGGININKSTPRTLYSELYADTTPIPMDAFAPKFKTPTHSITVSKKGAQKASARKKIGRASGDGVSVEIIKGKRETIPFAFMIVGAKPRVFARGEYRNGTSFGFVRRHKRVNKDGNDIPIKPLLSVAVHTAVINKQSLNKIETKVNAVFPVSLERNISFLLSKVHT